MKNLLILFFALYSVCLHAQWTRTNGLTSGHISDFARVGDTIVVNAGELYYSIDRGGQWSKLPSVPIENPVSKLLYTGGELVILTYSHDYSKTILWGSADFGQTWTKTEAPDSLSVYDFFKQGPFIYISDNHGMFRTNDNGMVWEQVTSAPFSAALADTIRIFGVSGQNALLSSDGGISWDTLLQGLNSNSGIAMDGNDLFVLESDVQSISWISTDGGQSWDNYFFPFQTNPTSNIYLHQGKLRFGRYGILFRSDDFGMTWETYGLTQPANALQAVIACGDTILTGTNYTGVYRQVDPDSSWEWSNEGLYAADPVRLVSAGGDLYATYHTGLWRLADDQINWEKEGTPLAVNMQISLSAHDYLKKGNREVLISGYSIYTKASNGGWQPALFLDGIYTNSNFSRLLSLKQNYVLALGSGADKVVRSFSDAAGFYPYAPMYNQEYIVAIAYSADNEGNLYVVDNQKNVYRSVDSGDTFELLGQVTDPDFSPFVQFYAREGTLILGIQQGINISEFRISDDEGANWFTFTFEEAQPPGSPARIHEIVGYNGWLAMASGNGVFVSADQGHHWAAWNEGLIGKYISSIAFHNEQVWIGVQGFGIWKRSVSELQDAIGVKEQFRALSIDVFPNPTQSTLYIGLPEVGELSIWNIQGRLMERCVLPAGQHRLETENWPRGAYHAILVGQSKIWASTFLKI